MEVMYIGRYFDYDILQISIFGLKYINKTTICSCKYDVQQVYVVHADTITR